MYFVDDSQELTRTQDNIHAGGVTLHELNILHDGIDLTGPLRLRLSAVPRFITRYHALRDQVAQLSLDAGVDSVTGPLERENADNDHGIPSLSKYIVMY